MRTAMAPLRGLQRPTCRLDTVALNAQTVIEQGGQMKLGDGQPLLRRQPIAPRRHGVVPRHAMARIVEHAEIVLGERVALTGGQTVPVCRLATIRRPT